MNSLIVAMLISSGIGAGVVVCIRALRPRPTPLAVTIAALDGPARMIGSSEGAPSAATAGWQRPLARIGMRLLDAIAIGNRTELSRQLRILDKPLERHAYEKLLGAIAGLVLPNLVVVTVAAAGVTTNPMIGLVVGGIGATAGFLYPDLPLSDQVTARQQAFRHALSSYLDLVTIILAGGGGIESALRGAADAGDGWAFDEIRSALRRAEFTGRTPWEAFDDLGADLDITELSELAASVGLAGGQGAKIRRSLAAKADALRAQQAAAIETSAETRTEQMIVPVTVMIVGLTLFVGFGAVQAISTDGGAATVQHIEVQP